MLKVIAISMSSVALVVSTSVLLLVQRVFKSYVEPRVRKGALIFDHEPRDRSGIAGPSGTILGGTLPEGFDLNTLEIGVRMAGKTPMPEVRVSNPTSGLVGFIDSQGVLRTERGRYDPLAGQVVTEPSGSLTASQHIADVIDLGKRRHGEQ